MSANIFDTNNQFIVRFPENVADVLHEYFSHGSPSVEVTLERDPQPGNKSSRICLIVGVNDQKYKATVVDLPTTSSTFKTIDRFNFFKSNDISEMILVHEDEFDIINDCDAETITNPKNEKIDEYLGESGITEPSQNIRQNFRRKRPIL